MNLFVAVVLSSFIVFPLLALAQEPQLPPVQDLDIQTVFEILQRFVTWMFTGLLIVAVVFIIVGAFKYLTSQGDPGGTQEATRMIIYAGVAVAAALLSIGILSLVGELVGAEGNWNPFGGGGASSGGFNPPSGGYDNFDPSVGGDPFG